MARIRSIHPTQWTDSKFVRMSPLARLLAIGVRNEADDNGIFEWDDVQLKMRLLPFDNVDVVDLLAEMEAAQQVLKFTSGGREYGAIRNFGRFQRPRFPKEIYPITDDIRNWMGPTKATTETSADEADELPEDAASNTETAPQREGMEWRGEESRAPNGASPDPPTAELTDAWNRICGDVLPAVKRMTESRKTKLRKRMAEDFDHSLAGWEAYCQRIRGSPFLTGDNDRNWRADFDWVLEPGHLTKILEGKYDNQAPRPAKQQKGGWL